MNHKRYDNDLPYDYDKINFELMKKIIWFQLAKVVVDFYLFTKGPEIYNDSSYLLLSVSMSIAVWIPVIRYYKLFWDVLLVAALSIAFVFLRDEALGIYDYFPYRLQMRIRHLPFLTGYAYLRYKINRLQAR
jgi:hypothetical protein